MSDKILKSYTNIPQHLYVERSADKQLKSIIEDMQRPGYVLVARQMGKTNLLLNAMRNLQTDKRKFVYIDLSNRFNTERDCYEFIIESIFDMLEEELWDVRDEIEEIGRKARIDHSYYNNSIRKILKHISKDLVIVLDEIDALRTADYSDNFFSLIRSNYFTRTSYPEQENLTYILSGVIEPKDLIKDRNKSPFNIGEKIYLDDFSREEFYGFISKSQINISTDLKDHIYSWTQGNPRLSFDICSELESIILQGETLNPKIIDDVIESKYLKSYDIAPIDHIRELVSDSTEIRDAVYGIITKNTDNSIINDATKNKLYLYGIISSNKQDSLKIKNPIIEKSLNKKWLESLEFDVSNIINAAIKLINESNNPFEGKELLIKAIELEPEHQLALHYLGVAERALGNFSASIKFLSKKPYNVSASSFSHFNQKLLIALNYQNLNDSLSACREFEYILENSPKESSNWYLSAVTLGMHLYTLNREEEGEKLLYEVLSLKNVEEEEPSSDQSPDMKAYSLSYSGYFLSLKHYNNGEKDKALELCETSLELGVVEHYPKLMLLKRSITNSSSNDIISDIVNHIIKQRISLTYHKSNESSPEFDFYAISKLMAISFENNRQDFTNLFNHIYESYESLIETIVIEATQHTESFDNVVSIIEYALNHNELKERRNLIRRYIVANLFRESKVNSKYQDTFNNPSILNNHDDWTFEDSILLLGKIEEFFKNKQFNEAIEYFNAVCPTLYKLTDDSSIKESGMAFYLLASHYFDTKNFELFEKHSSEALRRLQIKTTGRSLVSEEQGKQLVNNIISARKNHVKKRVQAKTYKPNDMVMILDSSGSTKRVKFKTVKNSIKQGLCKIIEEGT